MDIDPNQVNAVALSLLTALKHLSLDLAVGSVKDAVEGTVNNAVSAVSSTINPAYKKAMADTLQRYPNCEGLIDSLRVYCQSTEFEEWQKSYSLSQHVPINDFYSRFTSSEYGTRFGGDNVSQETFRFFVIKLETHMRLADKELDMQQRVSFEHQVRNQFVQSGADNLDAKRPALNGVPPFSMEDQKPGLDPLSIALNFARQLLSSGLIVAGQAVLQQIKAAITTDTERSIAFSTYVNLGNCNIMLDEYESAKAEFTSAL